MSSPSGPSAISIPPSKPPTPPNARPRLHVQYAGAPIKNSESTARTPSLEVPAVNGSSSSTSAIPTPSMRSRSSSPSPRITLRIASPVRDDAESRRPARGADSLAEDSSMRKPSGDRSVEREAGGNALDGQRSSNLETSSTSVRPTPQAPSPRIVIKNLQISPSSAKPSAPETPTQSATSTSPTKQTSSNPTSATSSQPRTPIAEPAPTRPKRTRRELESSDAQPPPASTSTPEPERKRRRGEPTTSSSQSGSRQSSRQPQRSTTTKPLNGAKSTPSSPPREERAREELRNIEARLADLKKRSRTNDAAVEGAHVEEGGDRSGVDVEDAGREVRSAPGAGKSKQGTGTRSKGMGDSAGGGGVEGMGGKKDNGAAKRKLDGSSDEVGVEADGNKGSGTTSTNESSSAPEDLIAKRAKFNADVSDIKQNAELIVKKVLAMKMEEVELEIKLLEEGTHPDYIAEQQRIEEKKAARLQQAADLRKHAIRNAEAQMEGMKKLAVDSFLIGRRDLRASIIAPKARAYYALTAEHEKSLIPDPVPNFSFDPLTLHEQRRHVSEALLKASRTRNLLTNDDPFLQRLHGGTVGWAYKEARRVNKYRRSNPDRYLQIIVPPLCTGLGDAEQEEDLQFIRMLSVGGEGGADTESEGGEEDGEVRDAAGILMGLGGVGFF
ncbi:hypothetical protein HDV00_000187 [Rhizophlyctis rosea]|nr:hypothetical protein HDV00_000187 [Rhizophlyctis rosea]